MNSPAPLQVAVTVEQLWQPVPGGSGTYVQEVVSRLARDPGLVVTGIAARHSAPHPGLDGITVRHAWVPRRLAYDAWTSLRHPVGAVPDAAVVHATTWAIPPTRRSLVVTVHDLAFLRAPEHFTPRGNRFFRRSLDLVRRHADLVLVPSQVTADDVVAAGIDADRIRVAPLGVAIPAVEPAAVARFRRTHGLDRPYVLWTGTLEPRKNVATLLDAFSRLPPEADLDLVLVGPDGWGRDSVHEAVAALGRRAHRLGRLDELDLHAAYAGARAFAFPSLWEGFGLPVLEAMAHGIPVVTSSGTSMAEFVGDGGILIDPTDADHLVEALMEVTGARHGAFSAAAAAAAGRFTWESTVEATVAAYREVG